MAWVVEDPNPLLHYPVFEKIFGYLEASDLHNCMNTCSAWESYLKPKRCTFLFGLALPIVMKHLSKDELLNCRHVCRKWDESITQTYESHPGRFTEEGGIPHALEGLFEGMFEGMFERLIERLFEERIWYDRGMRFREIEDIARFLTEADSHPRNPFFGRSIVLETGTSEGYRNGWARLLQRFGNEIHHARLTFNEGANPERDSDPLESRLRDCLQLLPNLRSMNLDIWGYDNSHEHDLAIRVRRFLARTPLPQLPNLESFNCMALHCDFLVSNLISDSFTEKLKFLRTPMMNYRAKFRFPNLEELKIQMRTEEFLFIKDDYPHLKKLYVKFPWDTYVRFELVFEYLEQFKETLREVTIYSLLDLGFIKNDYRVNLPNLKKLEIIYGSFPGLPYEQLPALSSLPPIVLENRARQIEKDRMNPLESELELQQRLRERYLDLDQWLNDEEELNDDP